MDHFVRNEKGRRFADGSPWFLVLLGSRNRCAVVQLAHPEKLAIAELAEERLDCFYLSGLFQALGRFLGHFVVLLSIGSPTLLASYIAATISANW